MGDRVLVEEPDWQDNRGAIGEVEPRSTQMQRPPRSKRRISFAGLCSRRTDFRPLAAQSFFWLSAESTNLDLTLCLNKCDLITDERQQLSGTNV